MPTYVTHDEGIINVAKIDFESQSSVEIDADNGQLKIEGENVIINSTANSAAGNISIDSVGVLELNSSSGIIGIGNDPVAQNINIGTGAAARTITMGNTTGATGIALNSGTGGVALSSTDTGADAIQLNASAGGVDIDAAATKDVDISGGQVNLVSKDNAAEAISLLTNVGTTETITITNNQGTTAGAITLNAAAGGITLTGNIFNGSDILPVETAGDRVIVWDQSDKTLKTSLLTKVCFLEGTKITLPDKKYSNIEDLTLDDKVLTYNIDGLSELKDKTRISEWSSNSIKGSFSESGIRNIWINPTDSYLIINNKLRVTNHHLIHFRRNGVYYFNYAESLEIHDELLTDKGVYEPVELIELKKDTINVYNFELDKDQTYFADNYLVHHYCKLCSGYSNII